MSILPGKKNRRGAEKGRPEAAQVGPPKSRRGSQRPAEGGTSRGKLALAEDWLSPSSNARERLRSRAGGARLIHLSVSIASCLTCAAPWGRAFRRPLRPPSGLPSSASLRFIPSYQKARCAEMKSTPHLRGLESGPMSTTAASAAAPSVDAVLALLDRPLPDLVH